MRPEGAQAPANGGNKEQEPQLGVVPVGEGIPEARGRCLQALEGVAHRQNQGHRNDDEARQHDHRLKNVGTGNGQEAADKSIGHHSNQGDDHRKIVAVFHLVQSEYHLQQLGAGNEAGTNVKGDEVDANQAGKGAKGSAGIPKPLFQEFGKGQGIFRRHGVAADSPGQDGPGEPVPQDYRCNGPQVHHAGGKGQGRQDQHGPATGGG